MASSAVGLPTPRNWTVSYANNHQQQKQHYVRQFVCRSILTSTISSLSLPSNIPNFLCKSLLLRHSNSFFTRFLSPSSSPSAINAAEGGEGMEEENFAQAREVVSELLQEFGVSEDESAEIAFKSPKYTSMLVDGVRELDELSLWDSWSGNTEFNDEAVSFKMKVYQMAKQKGDKAVLPFLESLGLSLSSATHVARYLISETLPVLIHRVKYLKEIFFSGSDDLQNVGRKAVHMMVHLSIPADEDLQQTLSFFQKIQARRGGLDLLGSKDDSFRYLIESFPRLLQLPVESHLQPIVEFLESIGVPKGCMNNIFLLFPPIAFYDIEKDIKSRLISFEKISSGDKDVGKMLLKYPWIVSVSIQRNHEEVSSFFETEKIPTASIDRATGSWPHFLGCSISKLQVKVEQFGELGIRQKKFGHVIATSPQLLLQSPQEFLQVVSSLKDLGLDEEAIGKTLGRCPEMFASSIERTLKKKIGFLSSIGVSRNYFPRVIRKYPDFFLCDVDKSLRPRMKYLLKIGLSRKDVAFMVRRFSPLLGYSIEEVLRPKLEFLLGTMNKPIREVVDYPRYFSYSLEKKIKPRYWVLKGRNVDCSLKEMLSKNDEEFAADFMGVGSMLVSPSLD